MKHLVVVPKPVSGCLLFICHFLAIWVRRTHGTSGFIIFFQPCDQMLLLRCLMSNLLSLGACWEDLDHIWVWSLYNNNNNNNTTTTNNDNWCCVFGSWLGAEPGLLWPRRGCCCSAALQPVQPEERRSSCSFKAADRPERKSVCAGERCAEERGNAAQAQSAGERTQSHKRTTSVFWASLPF